MRLGDWVHIHGLWSMYRVWFMEAGDLGIRYGLGDSILGGYIFRPCAAENFVIIVG